MLTSHTKALCCSGNFYKPDDVRKFSMSQVGYVLGENAMKMSYFVGYGSSYPQYVHHRGFSIPIDATTGCKDEFKWLYLDDPPKCSSGSTSWRSLSQ
ncbi:hypothetical protein SLA2020_184720 [Shorea laevis]